MVADSGKRHCDLRQIFGGSFEHRSGLSFSSPVTHRVEAKPKTFQLLGQTTGATHSGSVCFDVHDTIDEVQQSVPRSMHRGSGRVGPSGLERGEQLCESTIPAVGQGARCNSNAGGIHHNYCISLAGSKLVSEASHYVCSAPNPSAKSGKCNTSNPAPDPRTIEKQAMAAVRLGDLWDQKLTILGWSGRATTQYPLFLANSTLQGYNRHLSRFYDFCVSRQLVFPPTGRECSSVLADFLCGIADSSPRPESQLRCTVAAIGHLYTALNMPNPIDVDVLRLVTALNKSGTVKPLQRTKVLPSSAFETLFSTWPDNRELTLNKLRQRAVTLFALVCMARPSDLAPLTQTFMPETGKTIPVSFSTDQLIFNKDGSLTVTFFGIKNDTSRTGFEFRIPPGKPVFIALRSPYNALINLSISEILKLSIKDAGL